MRERSFFKGKWWTTEGAAPLPRGALFVLARDFVREQSEGEWDEKTITADAEKLTDLLDRVQKGQV